MKKTSVFVFNSLNLVRGGLTKAVLTRANTLVQNNIDVVFLTLAFQPRFDSIIQKMYSSGALDKRVKVINFFNDYLKTAKKKKKKKKDNINEKEYYIFKDEQQEEPSYRYYKDGFYVKYKRYDKKGRLLFIDYMNESRHRYQRDEYNEYEEIIRSRHMDLSKNIPRLDRYYNINGNCAITVWVDQNEKEKRALIFSKNPQEYSSLYEVKKTWLEKKISDLSSPLIISDSRITDNLVANIKSKKAKRIAVLHNNHYESPYDTTAEIKKAWSPFFRNIASFDKIVFLTEEQKNDIEKSYGKLNSAVVIPHAVPETDKQPEGENIKYTPYLAVTLARYNKQKRLDEAIKSFSYVVKEIPEAQYHIYGFGKEQKKLEELIKKLGLTRNVKLFGFTSNPIRTYKSASCSILTSDFEGFGMVLTESLAAGTPVVSYDIKYGPKDIISDGINGFLVNKGNKEELANKIIMIMKNHELRKKLSHNANQVTEKFSIQRYNADWKEVIKNT